MDDQIILTDNGKRILEFMQVHDETFVGKDMVNMTGIKGVYGVLESLVRKGLVEKADPLTRDFTNNKGITKPKEYITYQLTPFGRNFRIDD